MKKHQLEVCASCKRVGILSDLPCLLTMKTFRGCVTCFDNLAVPALNVIVVQRETKWGDLDADLRNSVTIWCDESYMPVKQWAIRSLERQVVVYDGKAVSTKKSRSPDPDPLRDDDPSEIQRILAMQKKVVDDCPMFFQDPRPMRVGIFRRFLSIGRGALPYG